MNLNKTLVIVIVVLLISVGSYTLFTKTPSNKTTTNSVTQEENENQLENASAINNSKYIPYTPNVLEETKTTKRVLFFYANWCPTCKPANDSFTDQSNLIPNDVTVIRVNYNDTDTDNNEKDLAKKYGVTYQHTFVQIDENDNAVTKWNGGGIEKLLQNVK
jgi:thioredoxin 1